MKYTSWDNRRKTNGDMHVDLLNDSGDVIATTPVDFQEEDTTIDVHGSTWSVRRTDTTVEAKTDTGKRFVCDAGEKKFGRSKLLTITADSQIRAINESKSDWVYVTADEAEDKLGQFSGGNNGVRRSITEFEPGNTLTEDDKIFLSFVTRQQLEAKMSSGMWVLTLSLLILAPILVLLGIGFA